METKNTRTELKSSLQVTEDRIGTAKQQNQQAKGEFGELPQDAEDGDKEREMEKREEK